MPDTFPHCKRQAGGA